MAASGYYSFKGIRFNLTSGCGQEDGVTIDPDYHDITHPDFIEALRQALEFYPMFDLYVYIEMLSMYADDDRQLKRHFEDMNEAQISDRIADIQTLLSPEISNIMPPTVSMNRYFNRLLEYQRTQSIKIAQKKRMTKASVKPGFVYLLSEVNGNHYKIGRAAKPKDRLKTFNVKLPFKVEFEALIETDDMHALEAQLHTRYADKRIDGEWFALEPVDVEYIKSLAVSE